MTRGFEAINKVTIDAPQADVWDALTNPAKVKEYLHGTEMSTDWKEGSPIYWRGEWKGKPYEDKGKVLEVKPQRLLKYTHWSPLGGSEDKPENYHTVVYELAGDDGKTTLTLRQDNNPSQEEAEKMAKNNWGPVLEGLKEIAENKQE
ncbi:MAG: ATPase [Chloroflexi bacterium]|nr:MAG: ATPase [Chloroflexota bacterium]